MKLLVESSEDVQAIVEEDTNGDKSHFLSGIFMQAEETNKNGRLCLFFRKKHKDILMRKFRLKEHWAN